MCWCNPSIKSPRCHNPDCKPPVPVLPYTPLKEKQDNLDCNSPFESGTKFKVLYHDTREGEIGECFAFGDDRVYLRFSDGYIEGIKIDVIEKHENTYEKPPLGVMPKNIWQIHRCQDLAQAICNYVHISDLKIDLIYEWTSELLEHVKCIKERR